MQKLALSEVIPGMKLAQDVILEDGRILLLKGFTIKPRYIQRLKAYKVPYVYVEENVIVSEEADEERIYEDTFHTIKDVMEGIRRDEDVNVETLKETVNEMVQHIMNDDMVFMALTGIRDIDNYTFLHCVDVCIYSVITAKAMDLDAETIHEVGLAAILHDIGKCKIPLSILNKPGTLTQDEYEIMKRHAIEGMDIINRLPGVPSRIGRIVCQHHEKWDGSGYPQGLKSNDIDLIARIISIADVYDALTANRVYRKRFMPHVAAEYLMAQSDTQFDSHIVKCFIDSIAVYPQDIIVLLNTGEIARVLPSRGIRSMRPTVSVITRKDGPPVLEPYEIDLRNNPTVFVVDIIS